MKYSISYYLLLHWDDHIKGQENGSHFLTKHTSSYYWLSAHLRTGKRKPLFNKTNFLLLVTTLGSAHLRSGKRNPLFNTTYNWVLLIIKL